MGFDDFATIMAMYPTTPTQKIAEEFGYSPHEINLLAATAEQGILKKATMGFDDFYIDIKKLRAENSQLKREVRRLRKELQK